MAEHVTVKLDTKLVMEGDDEVFYSEVAELLKDGYKIQPIKTAVLAKTTEVDSYEQ